MVCVFVCIGVGVVCSCVVVRVCLFVCEFIVGWLCVVRWSVSC